MKKEISNLIREIIFDVWERNKSFIIVIGGAFLAALIVQTGGIFLKLRETYTLLLMLIAFGISYETLKKKLGD